MIFLLLLIPIAAWVFYDSLYKPRAERNYMSEWSELDSERHRHFMLAIEARDEGRMAAFQWHYRIMERTEAEAKKVWNEKNRMAG